MPEAGDLGKMNQIQWPVLSPLRNAPSTRSYTYSWAAMNRSRSYGIDPLCDDEQGRATRRNGRRGVRGDRAR